VHDTRGQDEARARASQRRVVDANEGDVPGYCSVSRRRLRGRTPRLAATLILTALGGRVVGSPVKLVLTRPPAVHVLGHGAGKGKECALVKGATMVVGAYDHESTAERAGPWRRGLRGPSRRSRETRTPAPNRGDTRSARPQLPHPQPLMDEFCPWQGPGATSP